jgi:polysaccharide export outer membrane protein
MATLVFSAYHGARHETSSVRKGHTAVALALAACAALPALAQERAPTPAASGASTSTPTGYVIGISDVLRIVVWKEPDLTLEVTVRPDGMITLPLIGDVVASGRAPGQLARTLATNLGAFIQNPRVTVAVTQAASARVYVVGQMVRPGEFPLTGRMTVLKALALAGGFKEFAKSESIVIIREDQTMILFNYKRIADGKDMSHNIRLVSGDTIVVP